MLRQLYRFVIRLRYPVCCPEDIGLALGIELSNSLSFDELVAKLAHGSYYADRLEKYMERPAAECAFANAQRIERFQHNTLASYYFHEGWMEFSLQFDAENRLRRVYLQHQYIPTVMGVEITLKQKLWPHCLEQAACRRAILH